MPKYSMIGATKVGIETAVWKGLEVLLDEGTNSISPQLLKRWLGVSTKKSFFSVIVNSL